MDANVFISAIFFDVTFYHNQHSQGNKKSLQKYLVVVKVVWNFETSKS